MQPCELSGVEARRLIGNRELSPVELMESCIHQIERVDGALNAMVTRAFERARHEARQAEALVMRGEALPALHGLPVAIKDIHDTEGITTTYGSESFAANVPKQDSAIVARVRAAGGIVIGKTNVPEHSIGANTVNRLFGATGNPFDVTRTCGGSSGGSAVAVASNMAPLATGSDHGGSLRIPACFCGVVGYRATPGVVPNERRTVAQTFYSVPGPMARNVEDTALLLSVVAGRSHGANRDPMVFPLDAEQFKQLDPVDVARLRIGVTQDLGGVLVSDASKAVFADRMQRLARRVRRCEEAAVNLSDAPGVDWRLRQSLFLSQYHRDAASWDAGFNPNIRATYDAAMRLPLAEIAEANRRQMELYQHFAGLFDDFDVLICPGVSVSPFPWTSLNPTEVDGKPVENYMAWLALTASITVVGHPVVALPCGVDSLGLPFGIQIIGPAFSDLRLLAIARSLEQVFANEPTMARPQPDLSRFIGATSDCGTRGKTVQLR